MASLRPIAYALTSYRRGDAAPIVERFTEASTQAITNGRQLIAELRAIRRSWNDRIGALSDSAVWRVADLLTRRPVVNAALLAEELGIDPTNAHRYLTPLAEAGILVETTSRPRNRAPSGAGTSTLVGDIRCSTASSVVAQAWAAARKR